jgi:L-ascorbate metabolism protein UlaG (beta-lactamase superfamily)
MKRLLALLAALALAACATSSTAPYTPTGKIEVLWLGQSAFRVTTLTGKVIVIDPWLITNPRTPAQYKDLKNLGKVDAILVTHGHPDHVTDAPALAKLNNTRVTASSTLLRTLNELGVLTPELSQGMNKGGTVTPLGPDIKITMVRAEHSSEYVWRNPATGKDEIRFGGEPAGFIIELENGFKIYHMGDSGLFGDMRLIADYYKPDLVLIPIGGNFTINAQLAAYALREFLRPRFAIPMHYGTFPLIAANPDDLVKAVGGAARVMVLQPGEKAVF